MVDFDGAMMPVTLAPRLSIGRAVKLFQGPKPPAGRSGRPYDISPTDGRFLVTRPATEAPALA